MSLEFAACPACRQKLALFDYMTAGSEVVCANPECLTYLRIESRRPLKLAVVPDEKTHNAEARPESYA